MSVLPDTGGLIWEVVAHGGLTVLTITFDQQRLTKKQTNKNVMSIKRRCETACMITARTDPNFNDTDFVKKFRLQQKET